MTSPPSTRPDLFGPVHPAHPPIDAPGILAWLVGSKGPGKSVRRAAPTPKSPKKQAPVLFKGAVKLAAFAKQLRGIFFVAVVAALGLIGTLVWLLRTPLQALPQLTTPAPPIERTVNAAPASAPTATPPAGGATVEVSDAPGPVIPALSASGRQVTAAAPKPSKVTVAASEKKPGSAPAVDASANPATIEPPDMDTQAIESILPHLPPVRPPENGD